MATKKSLGDLLRQEVQKNSEAEENSSEPVAVELLDSQIPEQLPTTSNNSELETTIIQLKDSLEEQTKKEESLQKQIKTLKADLKKATEEAEEKQASLQEQINALNLTIETKNSENQKLQKQLEKANSLKTELEKVKAEAKQLADSNNALEEEIKALKPAKKQNTAPLATQQNTALATMGPKGRFLNFPDQRQDDPADFASNTWLLD